jgi:glycine oxidase
MKRAGIIGAGLVGRLLAVELINRGWTVHLSDPDSPEGHQSCAWTGAGMLAPYCELESSEPIISKLGIRSLKRWPELLARLDAPVEFSTNGSLVVAHPEDRAELDRLRRRVEQFYPEAAQALSSEELLAHEPQLDGFQQGLFFEGEGHVGNRSLLAALHKTLTAAEACVWQTAPLDPTAFDWVFDCRGLGARTDLPDLRGVRGEVLYVHAPEVSLSRPVRLMHPRYPLYIVPRPDHVFVIGATQIESEDRRGITVRSSLELLSALYSLHSGFAEAEVLESSVNCRPAFPDNLPRIQVSGNHIAINGLYRHGFLISPTLVQAVADYTADRQVPEHVRSIWSAH